VVVGLVPVGIQLAVVGFGFVALGPVELGLVPFELGFVGLVELRFVERGLVAWRSVAFERGLAILKRFVFVGGMTEE